ncbi:homeobox protein CDX-2 isoform X1 [Podarcis raffonei]|uniref:homeobox protein CDX-2 isoform X1 n=1 Tax=Podarcis raffonei TaxID=65483 RepID=UPI0023298BDB|nr:homeobox protein CDX-2 isoform X1 [Podarcis raffonei]
MYVSYLLEKDGASMYPGSVRHAGGLNLAAAQNFVGAPQYSDYGAYHVPAGIGLDNAQSPGSPWPGAYGAPLRDDWNGYGQGGVPGAGANAVHGPSGAAGLAYSPVGDYHPHPHHHHPAQGPPAPPCGVPASGGLMQPLNSPPGAEHLSPGGQRRNPCDWIRKPTAGGPVKTRTKDKYRVVYTDHQRLELEKEFHYSRYITIRRKAELAANLGLSERQVKIWFQNRRAKERKINKKKLQQSQPGGVHSGSEPMSPVSSMQPGTTGSGPNGGGVLSAPGLVPATAQ